MTLQEIVENLNKDLSNEWTHMNFYLHSASIVQGMHRPEVRELLLEAAASEMKHVDEFSSLILGLSGVPTTVANEFPKLTDAESIIYQALKMETEVLQNYLVRMEEAEKLGGVDGRWITIFLEEQMQHSREDADNLRQMLGNSYFNSLNKI